MLSFVYEALLLEQFFWEIGGQQEE